MPLASTSQTGLDVQRVRRDFPILTRTIHGRPLVYLDSGASSQRPLAVIDAVSHYEKTSHANIHRGVYVLSEEATAAYEQAHVRVGQFINADWDEVVFTRNTTEALNLVAYAWGLHTLRAGDEVVVTQMEHHSNIVPWQQIARHTGATVRYIRVDAQGHLDLDHTATLIGPRTKMVSVTHVSNVLGTVNPVRELGEMAHVHGALLCVDGAQSIPHMPIDVRALGCDFFAFSGHKMLGPTGIGGLWGRRELLEEMPPFLGGGGMIREVFEDRATWAPLPEKFDAGTPNIADSIALGVAVDYLDALGMDNVRRHEVEVAGYALERLSSIPDVAVYGPRDPELRTGVVSFNLEGVHPHDAGTVLDEAGIAVRAGHHCCQPLHRALDVAATLRASFYIYNSADEVDALVDALGTARRLYQRQRA